MDQQDQTEQANVQGQQESVDLPSINSTRTPPSQNTLVHQSPRGAYGATESEVLRGDDVIAPTFSDMEPGAGHNYGAAGDPDAPNLGGREDETTLGPYQVRPPDLELVCEGEFETEPTGSDAEAHAANPAQPYDGTDSSDRLAPTS